MSDIGSKEEDFFYISSWFHQPRGFIDLRHKEAERFDELLSSHLSAEVLRWDCHEEGWVFEFEDLILDVKSAPTDPVQALVTTWTMHRTYIDPLRRALRRILGTPIESRFDMMGFAMILLRLVEEAVISMYECRNGKRSALAPKHSDTSQSKMQQTFLGRSPCRTNIDQINESRHMILGLSAKDIIRDIPSDYDVLNIEPVFRDDLVERFKRRQEEIRYDLSRKSYSELRRCVALDAVPRGSTLDNHNDLVEELARPSLSFHGTQRHVVSSIVRWGFLRPGDEGGPFKIPVRCGSTYGVGIYSSPQLDFSLSYCTPLSTETELVGLAKTTRKDLPGLRIIVCAALMGIPVQVTGNSARGRLDVTHPGAHSHIGNNNLEWIVFNPAQLLPCYVLHLDLQSASAQDAITKAPKNPANWRMFGTRAQNGISKLIPLMPGELEAIKRAKKAAALKYFPYGYGPAKGMAFVIEEIGETSDDEEVYGEFQGERIENGKEVRAWEDNFGKGKGKNWMDEYQKLRNV